MRLLLWLPVLAGAPAIVRAADSLPPAPSGRAALVENALVSVPADDPRAVAYMRGRHCLAALSPIWGVLLLLLIVAGGLGRAFADLAARMTGSVWLQVALVATLLTVTLHIGSFPVALYGFVRERRFGFATQGFWAWLGDQGKGLLIAALLQAIFFPLLYVAIRKAPRLWWLAGAGLGVLFMILVLAVAPVLIAPLFNTFRPLRDAPLRRTILAMARAQGIRAEEVYEVDASLQSRHTNAYVAGLLGTRRIVLYDTLLESLAPREIEFVMGHEMGHYVRGHIWRSIAWGALAMVLGAFLLDLGMRAAMERVPSLGVAGAPASLPLLVLIAGALMVLLAPAANAYSRSLEREADRFGLQVTADPLAAASSFVKFGRHDLGTFRVARFIEAILYTHPSLSERIESAREYARLHPEAVQAAAERAARTGS